MHTAWVSICEAIQIHRIWIHCCTCTTLFKYRCFIGMPARRYWGMLQFLNDIIIISKNFFTENIHFLGFNLKFQIWPIVSEACRQPTIRIQLSQLKLINDSSYTTNWLFNDYNLDLWGLLSSHQVSVCFWYSKYSAKTEELRGKSMTTKLSCSISTGINVFQLFIYLIFKEIIPKLEF